MNELTDKTAVVTGVTSGIGEVLVARLIAAGANVIGIGRDTAKLERARSRWGAAFKAVQIDLANPARSFEEVVQAVVDKLDFLVNNAAECVYETPLTLPMARWRSLLETNLLAAVELTQLLAPRMCPGSHVVNISSVTARFLPSARFSPYALTKVALDRFTEALRLELDPRDIRVTLVATGLVDTPIYDKVRGFQKARAKLHEQVPTWLAADDVTDAIMWVLARPAHVVVGELTLLPRGQAR